MPPALPLVLRVPRHDHDKEEPDFVLVHVSPAGRHPLDLKLIGTENSALFALELKHTQTSALKARNAPCSKDEWDEILSTALCGSAGHADLTDGLEATAKVDSEAITITIQKRIEGITQKLGTLTLPPNEDAEVDLYEWLGLTVSSRDASKNDLFALQTELQEKDARIKLLEDSHAELIKLKSEHETELLEKFSTLLNEKKLKIRDQQRLLASAHVDPSKLSAVEATQNSHSPGPSRPGKRKSKNAPQITDSDSDSGFKKMDVDVKGDFGVELADDSEQEQTQTPEDTTEDEDTEHDDELPVPGRNRKSTKAAVAKGKEKSVMPNAGRGRGKEKAAVHDKPPPKRELPFAKTKGNVETEKPKAAAAAGEGSETQSDDDEL